MAIFDKQMEQKMQDYYNDGLESSICFFNQGASQLFFNYLYQPTSIVGNEEDEEGSGSIAYVPPDPENDVQLGYAKDLLRGLKEHASFPPDPEKAVPSQN